MNNKIKICFVLDVLSIGGVSNLTLKLISKFDCNDYDITLLSLCVHPEVMFEIPPNMKVERFPLREFGFIRRLIKFKKLLKGYDIIHSSLEYSNFYCSLIHFLSFKKRKYICTIHGIDGIYVNDEYLQKEVLELLKWKYILSIKYIQNFLFKFCDLIIAVSENTKSFLVNYRKINQNKIKVIYHGLSILQTNNENNEINYDLRELYNIAKEDFVIGYIGRLGFAKGLESLITVFYELNKINSNFKLLLVGDGERKDVLINLINKYSLNDKCIITGFVKETGKFYNIINLFVLPSKSEGIPVSLWEAMYHNTLTLCSNVGGIPETIKDGVNGFLFPKDDLNTFKNLILYIFENCKYLDNIRKNAMQTVYEKFNFDKNAFQIIEEFKKIAC